MTTKKVLTTLSFFLYLIISHATIEQDSLRVYNINNKSFSENGKWLLINQYVKNTSKNDSTLIFNQLGELIHAKPLYEDSMFFGNNFVSFDKETNKLEILNLKSKVVTTIDNVSFDHLELIGEHDLIFYHDINKESYQLIKVTDKGKVKKIWETSRKDLNYFTFSPNFTNFLVQYKNKNEKVEVYNLETLKHISNYHLAYIIKSVIWDKKQNIVFLSELSKPETLHSKIDVYNLNKNTIVSLELDLNKNKLEIEAIDDYTIKIIQSYKIAKKNYDTSKLQILGSNATNIDLQLKSKKNNYIYETETIIYDLQKKNRKKIETLTDHHSLNFTNNLLLYYNGNEYHNFSNGYGKRVRDIKIFNTNSQKTTTVTVAQPDPKNTTSFSPYSNFFIYAKNNSIYFYNVITNQVEKIIEMSSISLNSFINSQKAWSKNGKYFYFIKDYNISRFNSSTKEIVQITNNDDQNVSYEFLNNKKHNLKLFDLNSISLDEDTKILVKEINHKKNSTSLYLIDDLQQETVLNNSKDRILNVIYSKNFESISYSLENFNKPKTSFIYSKQLTKKVKTSKTSSALYDWKKQKIITYKDMFGNELQGVLFYPKDYDSKKKYPLVAYIYEIQNTIRNKFTSATYENFDGFNLDLLLLENYFVFFPDIKITDNGPGISALNCVTLGIKNILDLEKSIDRQNMGIFGHSFGGYAVNFILSKTNLFNAAISGNGDVDFIRSYFYYNSTYLSPNYFQYETGQNKMSNPFYLDKDLYLQNSPIMNIENVSTPLLSFTGNQDEIVDWQQTMQLYISMVRYNKPYVALIYDNESHYIKDKENQKDLTKRIIQWFDYFLKEKRSPELDWIKTNTNFNINKILPD